MERYQQIKRLKDKKTTDYCKNVSIWFSNVTLYQHKSVNKNVGERYRIPQDTFWWIEGQVWQPNLICKLSFFFYQNKAISTAAAFGR